MPSDNKRREEGLEIGKKVINVMYARMLICSSEATAGAIAHIIFLNF